MITLIALFRGINVGGKNIIKMKELVHLLEGLGLTQVQTYIQSGNAVFHSSGESATLSELISQSVKQHFGFTPQVLVLTQDEFENVVKNNPFPEAVTNPGSLHLGFLAHPPENPNLEGLENLKSESEQYHLTNSVFYLYAPEGIGRSKLAANSEKLLGVPMTDRNWKTVCKIQALIEVS